MAAYDAQRVRFESARTERRIDLGEPQATRSAIHAIVDAVEPPRRVFSGRNALQWVQTEYTARLAEWERWQPVSVAAHGAGQAEDTTIEGMVPRGAFDANPEK